MNSHEKVLESLPWFVNGTLNEQEHSMVNEHLPGCRECNDQVNFLIKASKQFQGSAEISATSFEHARSDFLHQLGGRKSHSRTGRWMIPASLAACLMIAVFLTPKPHQESFEVLSNTTPDDGQVIQLVFQPDTPEKSIRSLVLGDQGHIISGPTVQGVYRLELPLDIDPQQVLERLRNHPDVQFAELEANP